VLAVLALIHYSTQTCIAHADNSLTTISHRLLLHKCAAALFCSQHALQMPTDNSTTSSKANSNNDGTLSMGFGFVEFADAATAQRALSQLQGVVLDGHALELKHSTKRLAPLAAVTPSKASSSSNGSTASSSKLICRNVAFQATAKEIRELFGSYGQLKRVRMPKKFDGSHRGFAFVDFATPQEALNAYRALASTHLYGRHLVLEWAAETSEHDSASGAGIDALRAKAAKDVSKSSSGAQQNKRVKFDEDGNFAAAAATDSF
jgi:multiple RNA-binding domain-containing protein 1